MGLRVLLDVPPDVTVEDRPVPTPANPPLKPGLAYLASRRAELAVKEALLVEANRVEDLVVDVLEGLHRRRVVQGPVPGRDRLLSFAFLVPRANLGAFREAMRTLHDRGLGKVLSTGPWPPYHFASPMPVESTIVDERTGNLGRPGEY
jgi:hypothetical protein